MPKWTVVERDASEEEESSDEDDEQDADEEVVNDDTQLVTPKRRAMDDRKPLKISLLGSKVDVCKVCGKKGHRAGFVGATYIDCPNKPCYLCKQLGHTTATCPYKVAPGHGCTAASAASSNNTLRSMLDRECYGRRPHISAPARQWKVESAILKLHTRRCCCLEFHHRADNIVVSGDKKGAIAVWNFEQVHERTLFTNVHEALCNTLRFLPWLDACSLASASSDGTVALLDIETGSYRTLLDLNPNGWVEGGPWHMAYGCDTNSALGAVLAGDSKGMVHILDPRLDKPAASLQLHRKGNKVVSVSVHPMQPAVMMSAGNDHTARLFDVRQLASGSGATATSSSSAAKNGNWQVTAELACMQHSKVVNAAYFSPVSGSKLLTTCQDNRVRVWDYVLAASSAPSREIVHSHDFNRYLTPFKAEWDPKDLTESQIVIGRYISEDYGGVALHPVDIISASTGQLLASLTDFNLSTICPVNKPHPRRDIIVSGSSRSLYLWKQKDEPFDGSKEAVGAPHGPSTPVPRDPGMARPSGDFVFFDADPGGSNSKGKGKKRRKAAEDDDDDD